MSDRLTRGLAAMLEQGTVVSVADSVDARTGATTDSQWAQHWVSPQTLIATPTGKALASVLEAAEAWHRIGPRPAEDGRLSEAVDAWLAVTEP